MTEQNLINYGIESMFYGYGSKKQQCPDFGRSTKVFSRLDHHTPL